MQTLKPIEVTEDFLAAHWRMTPRRVRQLAAEGGAVRLAPGTYDLLASDRAQIAWLRRDESTQRAKRELMRLKQLEIERKLEEKDGQWLTLNEVRACVDRAWEVLWQAHTACLNHTVSAFGLAFSDQKRALGHALELDEKIKAALHEARRRLEELMDATLEEMACEPRRGILACARRIRALQAALIEDDAEEAADYRSRIGQRTSRRRKSDSRDE